MDFNDALNKGKDYAEKNPDKVEKGIDQGSSQIKDRTPDNVDGHVDTGASAAKDKLGLGGDKKDDKKS